MGIQQITPLIILDLYVQTVMLRQTPINLVAIELAREYGENSITNQLILKNSGSNPIGGSILTSV
jgi:hypothetical protein